MNANDQETALLRIQTAKKKGFTLLDLSDLTLADIPNEVFELKYLKELLLPDNLMDVSYRVRKMVILATEKTQHYLKIPLGELTTEEAERIEVATGLQLDGFVRVLDRYGVIHAFAKHGNPLREALRGQIAIENVDFEQIVEIVSAPDSVEYGEVNKLGNQLIKYMRKLENDMYYVEEIRVGRKEVALVTLYKRKPAKPIV